MIDPKTAIQIGAFWGLIVGFFAAAYKCPDSGCALGLILSLVLAILVGAGVMGLLFLFTW